MTESEYSQLADTTFAHIEHVLEHADSDLDYELAAGGVLEIEFDNGSKIIINRQGANHEIWVAAKSGGFHFRWLDNAWRDTRNSTELMQSLSKLVALQGGGEVDFSQN
ncbi:iron donor protein CyaY [Sulfuriferula sp.]|uniref:iron donor protein CyaY n=1 Tax=Sulfuriferula sp. TaxID=2025307 RepID=UPI002731B960|nr:iron donor protein CyaY [Sulfuriferula sp.]MDP2027370.1 iron donor protein CyaY [Sulfuriferula sp.]